MVVVAIAAVLSVLGTVVAFARPGSHLEFLAGGLAQVPLALLALVRLHRAGALREVLQPRWGDISMGVGAALVLYVVTWAGRLWLTPAGSSREGWLLRVYVHTGDPMIIQQNLIPMGLGVLVAASCDELAWRGLVFQALEKRFGSRWGWIVSGLLYGVALAPTAWWLRDPAGLNPLVVAAGLCGGLVWSFLVARTQRLVPSILSHALYVWFLVVQFRLFLPGG